MSPQFNCKKTILVHTLVLCFVFLLYYLIYVFLSVSHAQIVPCTTRLEFNESVTKRVLIRACSRRYEVHVSKGENKTRLHGKGWEKFMTKNKISVGDMLVFTMTQDRHPMIHVAIISGNSEDDYFISKDDSSYENSDNSDDDTVGDGTKIVIVQGFHLENHEKQRLGWPLPILDYVGLLFVTRLTRTNLKSYNVVCT